MSAATATAPMPSKSHVTVWGPPQVEPGDIVTWYCDGDIHNPHVAIVTRVYQRTVNLNILSPTSYNMMIRDGVRHVGDSEIKANEAIECGTWDHSGRTKRFLAMEATLKKLEG